jgi:hypothetical protein
MFEIVGNTAGEIWKYLDKNGSTSIAKLIRETKIDEKNIQRGIGWLSQEDKVSIEIINRVETISLK